MMEGNENVPFSFYHMPAKNHSAIIEEFVNNMLIAEPEYFLVEIKIKPRNNIKVFLDGDDGITIEKCVQFNRKLYRKIEENSLFPVGEFSLEISSAGVDRPLSLSRQYLKNIGRNIEIVFSDNSIKEGKLVQVTTSDIILEETSGKGKKVQTQQILIPFSNIKTTTVQIQF